MTVTPEWETATGLPALMTGSIVCARAVATSSGTGRAVMQTTMTTTDAASDEWVIADSELNPESVRRLARISHTKECIGRRIGD